MHDALFVAVIERGEDLLHDASDAVFVELSRGREYREEIAAIEISRDES